MRLSLFKLPRIYQPDSSDVFFLQRLNKDRASELLSYSLTSFDRITQAIGKCDNKAISTITVVISLSGALFLLTKGSSGNDYYVKIMYVINLTMALASVISLISCLMVKTHKIPTPVGDVIGWIKNEDKETLNERLIPSLIYSISLAEIDFSNMLERKTNLLKLGQLLGFLSVVVMYSSMVLYKILLEDKS